MPESPRWLVKAGRDEEARDILGRLRSEGDPEGERAAAEYADIVGIVQLEKEHAKQNSYFSMFFGLGQFPCSCSVIPADWMGVGGGDLHIARRIELSIWLQIVQE